MINKIILWFLCLRLKMERVDREDCIRIYGRARPGHDEEIARLEKRAIERMKRMMPLAFED